MVEDEAGSPTENIGTSGGKIGFYATTATTKATTGVSEAAFTANSGTAVNDNSTFGGYTLQKIAKALQLIGVLT